MLSLFVLHFELRDLPLELKKLLDPVLLLQYHPKRDILTPNSFSDVH